MENIRETLNRISNRDDFQKRFTMIRQEIMSHPDVRAFLLEHQDEISGPMIDRSLGKLYEFVSQSRGCKECPSLEQCKNIIPGYEPELVLVNNGIDVHYVPCRLKRLADERRKMENRIQCLYMPKDILQASLGNVILDTDNRMQAVDKVEQFISNYGSEHFQRGFYFYGPFGTGKTYLLGAVAHELAGIGISSIIVYVPELIREMKQAISDHTLNEKIDMLKKAPVLMFDDIGAEAVSSWVRDEVLGPILQFRMLERLPTFFTSNFNLNELEHHLTYSQRGEEEKLKAARIIERIKFLAEPVPIDGPNKRK
ncbi:MULTISPECIES: primosomal protein DnaI [Bacillaceae]|uniref:primosomal protein DnaI n=1 Tax=Bacillaceae TaxID=186817 RepID=UPI00203AC738|nr:primosomal protein DnaI [Caldibacillus thermoamylovorans]MCM3054050.1 primosomal protein DnaI [Caldibacillus thermoamylovorans]